MPEPTRRNPESQNVYLRLKTAFGDPTSRAARWREKKTRARGDDEASVPYGVGRDPKGLGDVMSGLAGELGWDSAERERQLDDYRQLVAKERVDAMATA